MLSAMTDEERKVYAHSLGYRQIGKDLPSEITLQQVISSMPKSVSTTPLSETAPTVSKVQLIDNIDILNHTRPIKRAWTRENECRDADTHSQFKSG